jgi:SAM-dependent methyltransferase
VNVRTAAVTDAFVARCARVLGPATALEIGRLAVARLAVIKAGTRARDPLERRWYASLERGEPDYGVYADPAYVAEAWACWVAYARRYVRAVATLPAGLGQVRSVADVGCGIGYSCWAWRGVFPGARVTGTNLPGTPQYAVAADVARERGFDLLPRLDGPADLLFASEYFEHFPEPVDHLRELLDVARPRVLVAANTFGAPSTGHFPSYRAGGRDLDGRSTSRAFARALREAGFAKVETGFWNARPAVWARP